MFKIDTAAGQVIATDTQNSVEAVNNAVMSYANLCASVIEVSKASNLPVHTAQKALTSAGEGLSTLIASRQSVADAVRELIEVQQASVLKTTSFGCPETPAMGQVISTATAQATA